MPALFPASSFSFDFSFRAFLFFADHGEEDLTLRRGRPLYLNAERLEQFRRMWACSTLLDEAGKEWHTDGNLY
jgi:hypothetical protein